MLIGAGQFVGLAGHSGTGDAGIFQNPDGSLVLRFENFDIQNGPDLEVYLVPGADQTSLADGSIHLGALKGNIGDQNYELPAGTDLAPGAYHGAGVVVKRSAWSSSVPPWWSDARSSIQQSPSRATAGHTALTKHPTRGDRSGCRPSSRRSTPCDAVR